MRARRLGAADVIQVIEVNGPTHDADWMLPGVSHETLDANAWLCPEYYTPRTNRLVFAFQLWLLRAGANTILIDTGVGNCKHRPQPWQHMINTPAMAWLEAAGVPPSSVTHVVHTHLHGDHVGWNTQLVDGRWEPTFPNAVYHLPEVDWCACKARHDAGETDLYGGSITDSVIPVVEAGLAQFVRDGDEIADCLTVHASPGHTPGHVVYALRDAGEEYHFTGDVLHSPVQVFDPMLNSRWCESPDDARASRHAVLQRAARAGATIFPAHAKSLDGWEVVERDGAFAFATPPAESAYFP
jgi:glyoxylase-like metal-dependent hydrolase (beta-lactamase superfamily II)